MSLKETVSSQWKSLTPGQRIMASGAMIVIALCSLWVLSGLLSSFFDPRGSENVRELPEQKIVDQVNRQLLAEQRFADVGMHVVWGPPPKFIVSGAVYSPADMKRLEEKLKELRPEGDYELQVELFRK